MPRRDRQSQNSNRRYKLSRPQGSRMTLPVIVLVCDDSVTAVAYFTELKREVKSKVTLQVCPAPCHGATPSDVIDLAAKKADLLQKFRDPDDRAEQVWVLIDLEAQHHTQVQANQAKHNGEAKGLGVALSMPCFEVWTLAHLIDTGQAFADCHAVVDRIRQEWRKTFGKDFPSKKAQADYSVLMPLRHTASHRASHRNASTDQSWTEVYKVIEAVTAA